MAEPDETTTNAPTDQPPSDKPPEPAFDPAKYVSREDYSRLEAQLAHMSGQVSGMAASMGRQVAPAPAPVKTYSDDELAEMLESGDGRKVLAAQRYITESTMRPVVDEFSQFRGATIATAESLGRDIVEARGLIPFYKDPEIKRQVDAFMNTLPPEARANKESLVLAHNYVVGDPSNFERLMKARVEEELRKRQGTPNSPDAGTPQGARVPQTGKPGVPSVKDLLGDAAAQALRFKGQTEDEFARRLGYKTWAEYAAVIEADQAASAGEEVQ